MVTLAEMKALADIAKGGGARHAAQRKFNDAKVAKRHKAQQAEKNLKGSGVAMKRVGRGPVLKIYAIWRELFDQHFPKVQYARWFTPIDGPDGTTRFKGGKETGIISALILGYSEELIALYLRYAFTHWAALRERFPKSPVVPTVGWLSVFAPSLVPEAQLDAEKKRNTADAELAFTELAAWFDAHPGQTSPPEQILARIPLDFLVPKGS